MKTRSENSPKVDSLEIGPALQTNMRLGVLKGSDRLLAILSVAYVASMALNETPLFGRSVSALIGTLTVLTAGYQVAIGNGRSVRLRRGPWTLVRAGPVLVLISLACGAALSASWAISAAENQRIVIAYFGLALTTLAVARGLGGLGDLPIITYVLAGVPVAVLTWFGFEQREAIGAAALQGTSLALNENEVALVLAVASTFAILLAARRHSISRVLFIGAALITAAGSLSAGSRSGLIGLVAGALVAPFLAGGSNAIERLRRFAIWVITLLPIALLLWASRSIFPPRLLGTINDIHNRDLSGREDIWATVLQNSDQFLPWGVGSGSGAELMLMLAGTRLVLHNTYLQLLVELGVVGLLLALLIPVTIVLASRGSHYRAFVIVGFVTWLPVSLTGSLDYNKLTWVLAALAIARPAVLAESPTQTHGRRPIHRRHIGTSDDRQGLDRGCPPTAEVR